MTTDRLSNLMSSLKNASMAGRKDVEVFHSNECEKVANILKEKGFLKEVKIYKPSKSTTKMIHIELESDQGVFTLTEAKRISKPGRRIYKGSRDIKPSVGKYGVLIVSTPKGIMDSLTARKKNLGGELLCEVY
ncbi:MAG TPA: 30S ribosomal protein S8 [bacterium]|nr:30S ribosomal protein S8 [bacterium]HOA18611.1 30S ribosomal protein S8 [bacterium]